VRSDVREALPLDQRAWLILGLLALTAVVDAVAVLADLEQLSVINRFIDGERVPFADLDAVDRHMSTVGMIQLVLLVVSAVAFLLWLSRAYRNSIAMGIRNPRYGTRWAIGCWFVPFVNLVVPKKVMNDTYRGSDPEMAYGDPSFASRPVDPLLHWWWGIWLLSGFAARYAGGSSFDANLRDYGNQAKAYVFSDVLNLVAAVLAILVVKKITDRAELRRHRFLRNQAEAEGQAPSEPPAALTPPAVSGQGSVPPPHSA